MAIHYRDRHVELDDEGLTIRRYYFPFGTKRVPYQAIRSAVKISPSRSRIWGTGSPRTWRHLKLTRPFVQAEILLDLGRRIRPVIAPKDVDEVVAVLQRKITEG